MTATVCAHAYELPSNKNNYSSNRESSNAPSDIWSFKPSAVFLCYTSFHILHSPSPVDDSPPVNTRKSTFPFEAIMQVWNQVKYFELLATFYRAYEVVYQRYRL